MGFLDKVKALSQGREKQIAQAVDKAGDMVNKKTGNKHAKHVDMVEKRIDDALGPDGTLPRTPGRPATTTAPEVPDRP